MRVKGEIEVYTDGAAEPNPGTGGWGAVIVNPRTGTRKELHGGPFKNTTNNRMELTAVCEALEAIRRVGRLDVHVYSDSKYVVDGITNWIHTWRDNGWTTSNGKMVKNADLWSRLNDARCVLGIVRFTWVKGHAGHPLNERADRLAYAARRMIEPEDLE